MPWFMKDESGSTILYALKLCRFVIRKARQKRITIIKTGQNEGCSQCICSINIQERTNLTDSTKLNATDSPAFPLRETHPKTHQDSVLIWRIQSHSREKPSSWC